VRASTASGCSWRSATCWWAGCSCAGADRARGARRRHGADRAFYEGKIAAARFFAATRLPLLSAERVIIEHTDDTLMELAEAGF
jgi:hypothetical protein